MKIQLRDGSEVEIDMEFELACREVYLNVDQEFARMKLWLMANPAKRPEKNAKRFIANWLAKSGQMRPLSRPLSVVRAVNHDTLAHTVEDKEAAKAHIERMRGLIKRVA